MRNFIIVAFIVAVGVCAYFLIDGAFDINLSINLRYGELHDAVQLAADNSK